MSSPNERLRQARLKAGFESARDAASAIGMPISTYIQHENGTRGFPAKRAPLYARRFKVSEEWLLYGKGADQIADPIPSETVLEQMVREILDAELTTQTRIADLPRIVGSALREQLERYQSGLAHPGISDEATAPDKGVQSPSPTKPGEPEEPRNA